MATPDNSDPIRCNMCGKMNEAVRVTCENCGARLRPLTPEELGLSPSPAEPGQPSISSGTDTLHMRFDIEDDPTMVGPSAAKANLDRGTPLDDEGPDFAVGGSPEPDADVPDWLRGEPQQDQPPSDIPDWLSQEAGAEPTSPVDIPDWLGESAPSSAQPLSQASDADAPDWLSDTSQSQATRPMSGSEETPEWLSQLSEPPAESEAREAASEVPDWLRSADEREEHPGEPPAEPVQPLVSTGMPDWLTQPPADEEPTADTPPTPKRSGVTDWLRGLGVEPTAEEIQAAMPKEPADESPQPAEALPPFPEEEAAPRRPISSIPLDETPDWLLALEAETSEDQPEAPATPTEADLTPPGEAAASAWLSDRDAEVPTAPSTPAEPESPAVSAEAQPDWLMPPQETAPIEFPQSDEPPPAEDWLSQLRAETPSVDIEAKAPDWLRAPGDETLAEPEAEAPSPAVPDWLNGMGAEAPTAPSEVPEPAAEAPDWLRAPGDETLAEPEAEAPSPAVPDWLNGMGAESAPSTECAATEVPLAGTEAAIPEGLGEATPPEPATDVPDWLGDLSAEASAPSAAGDVEVPDWLSNIGAGAPPSSPSAPTPEASAPGGDVEVPDWLDNLGEAEAPAPGGVDMPDWLGSLGTPAPGLGETPEAASPAVSAEEVPGWLSDLGVEAPAQHPPEISGEPGAPDWLSDLGSAPGPSTEQEPIFLAESAAPLDDSDAPDWLSMMDLDLPGSGMSAPAGGEDLLGLSEDLLSPEAQQANEEDIDLSSADLPEWLREAAPGEKTARPAPLIPSAELPPELAAELEGLRFEAITGERGDESITEKVGALKDVSGVIRPELLFDGASLRADEIVDQIMVTDEQARRIEAIRNMLAREAQGVVVTGQRRSTLPVVRWLVVLALIAAVVATRFFQPLSTPSAGDQPQRAREFIQSLPPDSTVLVAVEYEPDTAAEMQPLAEALLNHLARRGDITVYTLSTRPTGAAMAQSALTSIANPPAEWTNLGYVAGGQTGIGVVTIGALPGIASPLEVDYRGEATNAAASRLSDLDPAVIIVVSARSEHLRAWVEQAGVPLGVPMIAAVSAASTPLAYPYEQSGQFEAVLSGLNDAVAYNALENASGNTELLTTWNAQAIGGAAAAILILIGGVLYGLIALRQQEQE